MTPLAPPTCGFCKGEPVVDAATWLDGKERPPAPCPRCGVPFKLFEARCEMEGEQRDFERGENPSYGPGNPDWERDFEKDSAAS